MSHEQQVQNQPFYPLVNGTGRTIFVGVCPHESAIAVAVFGTPFPGTQELSPDGFLTIDMADIRSCVAAGDSVAKMTFHVSPDLNVTEKFVDATVINKATGREMNMSAVVFLLSGSPVKPS